MKMRLLGNRLIVKRDPPTEVSKGGIIIPEVSREKLTKGTVLEAGPGKFNARGVFVENQIKKGDRVVFGKYSGSDIEHQGETDRVHMTEDEVVAVIEEE